MRWLLMAVLAACAGCAPTTLAPMVIRLAPDELDHSSTLVGLRTGPRLTTPIAASRPGGSVSSSFAGDHNIFNVPQWGLAYDLVLNVPITRATALHLGAQGEFLYPLPLPSYGVYAGASHYIGLGRASIAPALIAHASTDFGIGSIGGPGSQVGGELTVALGWRPEERLTLGLCPFVSYNLVWSGSTFTYAIYTGGALVVRVGSGTDVYELSGGFGRVFMQGASWNAPILGVRSGH